MRDTADTPPTVAEVVGRAARELRGDRKLELVARAAKSAGLNWGTGRIADLEAGRVSPTLPTLYALCLAFGVLLKRQVRLAELLVGDGRVSLTADAPGVELSQLRAALGGQPIDPGEILALDRVADIIAFGSSKAIGEEMASAMRDRGVEPPDFIAAAVREHPLAQEVEQDLMEADYRMVRSLGLDPDQAPVEMAALWGRSFTAERDRRAGPNANPQKRGRISRELKLELQRELNHGDD